MLFRFKDIFTIGTIFCSFLVLAFASSGNMVLASIIVIVGFFLDALDGLWAKLTKTSNAFGGEFDRVADLAIYSMAPGILLFFAYESFNLYLAALAGFMPLLFGSIRLARFNVKRLEYPGYWLGLPRPASALGIVGFINADLAKSFPDVFGLIFVSLVSILNISFIPYFGHHERKLKGFKGIAAIIVILSAISIFLNIIWDLIFILSILYIILPFFITKKEKKKIRKFIQKWKA